MVEQLKKGFFTGSWNTYDIKELGSETELIPSHIYKNLSIFSESYKVEKEVFAIDDLICIKLCLEELPNRKSLIKKKKNFSQVTETKKKLKTYKFKFALSLSDSLLFCSRVIPEGFKASLSTLLRAKSLALIELCGSVPLELLLLHRQASDALTLFRVLMENHCLDCIEDNKETNKNEVFLKIGSSQLQTPKIKKLSCTIVNMPFNKTKQSLHDIAMSTIKVEMVGQSLFDLYQELAELNVISSVPEWVAACRLSGKTHRNINYMD